MSKAFVALSDTRSSFAGSTSPSAEDNPKPAPPTVFFTEADFDAIERLAHVQCSVAAELLRQGLDRAVLVPDTAASLPFIRLGSRARVLELPCGQARTLRVSHPDEADECEEAVSVLTPLGAALLGLSKGDSFVLTAEVGARLVVVLEVEGA